jgi:hypothetical protein
MMRLRSLVVAEMLVAGMLAVSASSQQASSVKPKLGSNPSPPTQPQIRSLINDSEGLPPEFTSDVILQLVEHGLVRDEHLKIKLLNEAFEKASLAQDDYPERPWGVNVEETPHGLHAIASMFTGLNRLSLQTRVVRQVLPTDPQRARQLFETIAPPRVQPLPCNESGFPWPDPYYSALTVLLDKGFSQKEIRSGLRANYVASTINTVKSHPELISAVQLLNAGVFTDQELRELVPAYTASVRNLDGDPQTFAIVMSDDRLFDGVSKLISLLDKHSIDSRSVLQALRDYLVHNFNGPGCSALATSKGSSLASSLPDALVRFNEEFAVQLRQANLSQIAAGELDNEARSHIEDSSPPRWKSKTYSDLGWALQSLSASSDPSDTPKTSAALNTFLTKANDLLTQVSAWSETSEPETEFFHQKAILLEGLAQRTEGTSLHKEALDRFIMFLQEYPPDQIGAVDWYLYATKLLKTNLKPNQAKEDLEALLNSREPVLTLYARLGLLLQTSASVPQPHVPQNSSTAQ